MTVQPQQPKSVNSGTNASGGVNANAEQFNVGADVVGRDKVTQTAINVQPEATINVHIAARNSTRILRSCMVSRSACVLSVVT